MSSNLLKPVALSALLALAGCGFTPLYGGDAGATAAAQLDTVAVQNIPERPGQILRESLQTQFYVAGAPVQERYALSVTYTVTPSAIGILEDTASTRTRYTAKAMWTLSPIGTPAQVLAKGTATAMNAEDVIDQQYFAADLQTNTVNQQLADEIATDITAQLTAWFRTHPQA